MGTISPIEFVVQFVPRDFYRVEKVVCNYRLFISQYDKSECELLRCKNVLSRFLIPQNIPYQCMELLDTKNKCICFQLRSFMEQFSRESRPLCSSNIKWILVSSSEIKETSIRSFRQDKENYGDHFITSSIVTIRLWGY